MTRRHTKSDVWSELDATDARVAAIERLLSSGGFELPGVVKLWAGPTAPSGYVFMDGSAYSRAEFSLLFEALGGESSVWGLPDAEHFNVPDVRGRAPIGVGSGTSLTTRDLGDVFGVETHTLTVAQMPSHTHDPPLQEFNSTGFGTGRLTRSNGTGTLGNFPNGDTGGGDSHPNVQPSVALNFIIKT